MRRFRSVRWFIPRFVLALVILFPVSLMHVQGTAQLGVLMCGLVAASFVVPPADYILKFSPRFLALRDTGRKIDLYKAFYLSLGSSSVFLAIGIAGLIYTINHSTLTFIAFVFVMCGFRGVFRWDRYRNNIRNFEEKTTDLFDTGVV